MLTSAWKQLTLHQLQMKLWRTKAQFVAVAAGRGSGKTELARRRVVRMLPVKKPWPDPIYFYALPTINQAKRIAWKKIKNLVPIEWIKKINETDMTIETIFGSTLYVMGMDKPQRAEGDQWDGGILDESCDQRPKVFDLSILPALSHRKGFCWRIGVPKRHGIGSRDFKKFYDLGINNNINVNNNINSDSVSFERNTKDQIDEEEDELNIEVESYTWPSSTVLTAEQLAWAETNLDAKDFNEQYNASWETASGSIFYAYKDVEAPEGNLLSSIQYNPQLPLIIGQDFNVDPMAWIIAQSYQDKTHIHVIDELYIRNTNTPAALSELYKRYGQHNSGFEFFGDASGRARKTSASISDYVHIKQDTRFHNSRVYFLKANPRVQDRFAACNAMFCNAKGERRLFIHPRCKNLRKDLQDRNYVEGSNEPDDYGDIGHISDALGYPIHRLFPIRALLTNKSPVVLLGKR